MGEVVCVQFKDDGVDEPDELLGKRTGGLNNENEDETVVHHDQYDCLYESERVKSFEEIGFPAPLLRGLYCEMHFEKPSNIQAETLSIICKEPYYSLVAQAQNGCGKTCCFALCILSRLDVEERRAPQALVVVPTRELAIQNAKVIEAMGTYIKAKVISTSITNDLHEQHRARPGSVCITEHVIVGTHGNLRIFRRKGWLSFNRLRVVVLDEADQMIEREGFRDDTSQLMNHVDNDTYHDGLPQPQLLLFSATYRNDIKAFADVLFKGRNTHKIFVDTDKLSLDKIRQAKVKCWGIRDKIEVVRDHILANWVGKCGKCIIFVRRRSEARNLHEQLRDAEWPISWISGLLEYHERDAVVKEFRNGATNVLISTDVLSRGFDVSNVNLVINFDIPLTINFEPAYETYLHRVGRTGRFKRSGAAFNLINMSFHEDELHMRNIEDYFSRPLDFLDVRNEDQLNEFLKDANLVE